MVTLIADRALAENFNHFRYEVIHEFGHALGFTHEQQRPDNWPAGTAAQCGISADDPDYGNYAPVLGGINLTATYDVNSIMNYCNPVGFPQDLSLGDIRGVRAAYGRRDVKGDIYAIDSDNQLHWYRHDGRTDGSWTWGYPSGNVVDTNWSFRNVFSSGDSDGILYAIDASNQLTWWRHDGRVDGADRWATGSGNVVGTGWNFTQVFGAGNGVIYGITPYVPAHASDVYGGGWIAASGGELKWYRHVGQANGTFQWAAGSGRVIGTGWSDFKEVFSGGDGIIYAVNSDDELVWYRHDGRADGSRIWAPASGGVVGSGWSFPHLVGDD